MRDLAREQDMEFFEVIEKRQSIRAYTADTIDDDTIEALLRAIRTTPTAGNLQAYRVYLVQSSDKIKLLAKAALGQQCVRQAQAVLVFCADRPRSEKEYGQRGRDLYCIQDTTIAATIAHLAATALGLGSVLVGAFNEDEAAQIVGAPISERPILMLPLGYPAERPARTGRRPLERLVVRI